MYELCRLRRSEGYEVCADEVRVERCGKSAPNGVRKRPLLQTLSGATPQRKQGLPGCFREGGWSAPATVRLDR